MPHSSLILTSTSNGTTDRIGVRDARVGLVLGAEGVVALVETVDVSSRSSRTTIGVSVQDVLAILLDETRGELATDTARGRSATGASSLLGAEA